MESFDLIIIGSGPAGYVAAIRAAQLKLKVACIDRSKTLGGTCLNVGCIPSKTLLHSSELFHKMHMQGEEFGISFKDLSVNFPQMMKRKNQVVEGFTRGIEGLFKKNRITRFEGFASLVSNTTVEIDQEGKKTVIEGKNILLATGSEPIELSFLPFDEVNILSSTGALALTKIPQKMSIIGAGVIGLELGSVYSRLGCEVTVIELTDRVCPTFDRGVSKALLAIFQRQGLKFHLSAKLISAVKSENDIELTIQKSDGSEEKLTTEKVLVAIGRRPFTKNLGLEKLNVIKDSKGFVQVDRQFRTSIPNIFAVGDIIEGPMLAHKASEEAIAAVELMKGEVSSVNYMAIPNVMYTWPEVAYVGFTEEEAKEAGLEIKIGQFPFKANSRARCNGDEEGFVKVISESHTERVIGVHIVGPNASEMIGEAAMAIEKRATAQELATLPHAHPTSSEAIKEAALGVYQKIIHL